MNLDYSKAPAWALTNLIIGAGLLCGALFFEFILGLAPCPLCMMQRLWFVMATAICYIGLIHNPRWGIYPALTALATLIGGGFSVRQLWLQSLPADKVPACGPDLAYMLDVFPLSDVLVAMTSGTGDCAEVAWSFLGITIPGWALLGFIAMFVCSFLQLRRGLR